MNNPLFRFSIHPLFFAFLFLALITGQWVQLLTLFGVVLFHEWGHLLWATYFEWKVDRILLLPFGGVMEVSSPLFPPAREEAVVVLGGPMNNLLLAMAAFYLQKLGIIDSAWGLFLVEGNLLLGLFNLLPLYPLDGGRFFQLLASLLMPYRRSLYLTLYVGVMLLFSFLILMGLGFVPTLSLWFLLPYLLYTSYREYRHIPYRMMIFLLTRYLHGRERRIPLAILSIRPEESIHRASFGMYRHRYHLFRVKPRTEKRKDGGEVGSNAANTKGGGEVGPNAANTKAGGEVGPKAANTKAGGKVGPNAANTKGGGEVRTNTVNTKGGGEVRTNAANTKGGEGARTNAANTKGGGEVGPQRALRIEGGEAQEVAKRHGKRGEVTESHMKSCEESGGGYEKSWSKKRFKSMGRSGSSRYIREERLLKEMFARKNPTLPIGLLEGKEEIPD